MERIVINNFSTQFTSPLAFGSWKIIGAITMIMINREMLIVLLIIIRIINAFHIKFAVVDAVGKRVAE